MIYQLSFLKRSLGLSLAISWSQAPVMLENSYYGTVDVSQDCQDGSDRYRRVAEKSEFYQVEQRKKRKVAILSPHSHGKRMWDLERSTKACSVKRNFT